MIKIIHQGRTGNQLLQNIGLSILSKKFDLKVLNYSHIPDSEEILGTKYNQDGRVLNDTIKVYDTQEHIEYLRNISELKEINCLSLKDVLEKQNIDFGLDLDCTFQLSQFVTNYRQEILDHFDLKYKKSKNSIFVHVRLGDVTSVNPGLDYYRHAILQSNFDNGYISSDSINHPIVRSLISEFNLIEFNEQNPIKILNFAKDFDNLVLSKGTFSWWIAMLSKSENIFFPKNDTCWYGNIFVFQDWKYLDIKAL